jgi:molybdopterin/thiamine biosynthesis adenylyltransferase
LGCPAGLYLSSSGVGKLGLCDNDTIELSNIHRQIVHETKNIGQSKAQNLADKCKEYYKNRSSKLKFFFSFLFLFVSYFIVAASLNDQIEYKVHNCLLEKDTAVSIIKEYPFLFVHDGVKFLL